MCLYVCVCFTGGHFWFSCGRNRELFICERKLLEEEIDLCYVFICQTLLLRSWFCGPAHISFFIINQVNKPLSQYQRAAPWEQPVTSLTLTTDHADLQPNPEMTSVIPAHFFTKRFFWMTWTQHSSWKFVSHSSSEKLQSHTYAIQFFSRISFSFNLIWRSVWKCCPALLVSCWIPSQVSLISINEFSPQSSSKHHHREG